MKLLIIEDEPLAARQLQVMVGECDPSIEILSILDSVESACKWLRTHAHPDLILADIELTDGQSFTIFEQVEVKSPVIFITAYDEYALQAFQVNSVDYLLKPVNEEALRKSLRKFGELKKMFGNTYNGIDLKALASMLRESSAKSNEYRERFLLKLGSRLVPVETKEIAYFFTKDRLTFVRTWDNRSLIVDYNLDELEHMLSGKEFYRANRQFILSPKSVDKVYLHFHNRLKLELKPAIEEEVYISRDKAGEFRKWMGE